MMICEHNTSFVQAPNPLYDIQKSFVENVESGPQFNGQLPKINRLPPDQWIDILGYKVASPLGVPACAIMLSKGIALASRLGFDVLVYKTIRCVPKQSHPHPNIVYVDVKPFISIDQCEAECHVSSGAPRDASAIAIANSFGNASFDNDAVRKDITKAKKSLLVGQILIVSVFGESADEFVQAALIAEAAGADIIELNLSCPNLTSKTHIYLDPHQVTKISEAVIKALAHHIPVTIKVGIFKDCVVLKNVLCVAAKAGVRGVCGINSVPMKILNKDQSATFSAHRAMAGVSGNPIRKLALDFVQTAHEIIKQKKLDLIIFGTGGITMASHFREFLLSGATVAMSATGMMWNPCLAAQYHDQFHQTQKSKVDMKSPQLGNVDKRQLAIDLCNMGAIKFGNFTLKSGLKSPMYIDLRLTISHPDILKKIALLCKEKIEGCKPDLVCGVPFAALPLAAVVSLETAIPMIMLRKEAKDHGTKKLIEGDFSPGQTCMIIEDVVTTGSSILETVKQLEAAGLKAPKAFVIVDRQQGGAQALAQQGYQLDALFSIDELLTILFETKTIDQQLYQQIIESLKPKPSIVTPAKRVGSASFAERSAMCNHPVGKQLFAIMASKSTNLVVAADVQTKAELLQLADTVGPDICMLKTHIDILNDFDASVPEQLKMLAKKHNFLLWEDRKFADIGAITAKQYTDGIFHIADWADVITVHAIAGNGVFDALASLSSATKVPACLLIAQMSSKGSMANGSYTDAVVQLALQYPNVVIGFVCQQKLTDNPSFIHCTPGVQFANMADAFGQQYLTPEKILVQQSSDIIIVGRGITQAKDFHTAAREYKEAGWSAYLIRQAS